MFVQSLFITSKTSRITLHGDPTMSETTTHARATFSLPLEIIPVPQRAPQHRRRGRDNVLDHRRRGWRREWRLWRVVLAECELLLAT